MEGQKISPDGPISSAYNGIQWTPFRSKLLSDFYNQSPIDMQCNQSDGSRFPGSWDAMPQPPFPSVPPALDPNEECFLAGTLAEGQDFPEERNREELNDEQPIPQILNTQEFLQHQLSQTSHNHDDKDQLG